MFDPATAASVPIAWVGFVGLLGLLLAALPLSAALLRRALPAPRRAPIELEPALFGHSPLAQRSPRQSVRMHRTLLATAFLALPGLLVLVGVAPLRDGPSERGIAGVERALALVVPTLLVSLHARRRSPRP